MATAALSLNCWNIEYYQAMTATERARLHVVQSHSRSRVVAEAALWPMFFLATRDTSKVIVLLEKLEMNPAYVLLESEGDKIPQKLQDLFSKMCDVIRQAEAADLNGMVLRNKIAKLNDQSQLIKGYADRFADAQVKLRSRVSEDQVPAYRESFEAYGNCQPAPEQFSEEDRKSELLRF